MLSGAKAAAAAARAAAEAEGRGAGSEGLQSMQGAGFNAGSGRWRGEEGRFRRRGRVSGRAVVKAGSEGVGGRIGGGFTAVRTRVGTRRAVMPRRGFTGLDWVGFGVG